MANIFSKLESYWDSDESYLAEYRECHNSHLQILIDINEKCAAAIAQNPGDMDKYIAWREKEGLLSTAYTRRVGLDEIVKSGNRCILLLKQVLAERGELGKPGICFKCGGRTALDKYRDTKCVDMCHLTYQVASSWF